VNHAGSQTLDNGRGNTCIAVSERVHADPAREIEELTPILRDQI
jgi:hypothetical protein